MTIQLTYSITQGALHTEHKQSSPTTTTQVSKGAMYKRECEIETMKTPALTKRTNKDLLICTRPDHMVVSSGAMIRAVLLIDE